MTCIALLHHSPHKHSIPVQGNEAVAHAAHELRHSMHVSTVVHENGSCATLVPRDAAVCMGEHQVTALAAVVVAQAWSVCQPIQRPCA